MPINCPAGAFVVAIRKLSFGFMLAGMLTPGVLASYVSFIRNRHERETGFLPDGIGFAEWWVVGFRVAAMMFLLGAACAAWSYWLATRPRGWQRQLELLALVAPIVALAVFGPIWVTTLFGRSDMFWTVILGRHAG
jgi:hypothetical protein